MAVHYLEIVSKDVDTLTRLYQRIHHLSFGPPDPDLGQARVATQADGALVGIRRPLAVHEQPIIRTYIAVPDIQGAVKAAEQSGAIIAYPPTRQGNRARQKYPSCPPGQCSGSKRTRSPSLSER